MKHLLLLLLLCAAPAFGFSQVTKQSISAVDTDEFFTLTVRLDKSRKDDLVAAYLATVEATTGKAPEITSFTGTSEMETAAGTLVSLNTKRNTLKIFSSEGDEASRAEAKELGDLVRTKLSIKAPKAPTPPAPPAID